MTAANPAGKAATRRKTKPTRSPKPPSTGTAGLSVATGASNRTTATAYAPLESAPDGPPSHQVCGRPETGREAEAESPRAPGRRQEHERPDEADDERQRVANRPIRVEDLVGVAGLAPDTERPEDGVSVRLAGRASHRRGRSEVATARRVVDGVVPAPVGGRQFVGGVPTVVHAVGRCPADRFAAVGAMGVVVCSARGCPRRSSAVVGRFLPGRIGRVVHVRT